MSSSSNKNIIVPLEIDNSGISQNFKSTDINNKIYVYTEKSNIICYIAFPFIILVIITWLNIKFTLDDRFDYIVTIIFSTLTFILLSTIILLLCFNPMKYIFKKDLYNNFIHIKKINYFCCSFETIDVCSKDMILDVIHSGKSAENCISIVNTNKDFDIDKFNIGKIPPKMIYILSNIKIIDNLKQKLCEFIECPSEAENPVKFDINKFMGKPVNRQLLLTFGEYRLSQYMKFNQNFFSFYLNLSNFSLGGFLVFTIFSNLFFIGNLIIEILIFKSIPGSIVSGIFLLIINIIMLNCLLYYNKRMRRIDIIFSNDFEKIFIGIINDKGNKYLNYFIFENKDIDKFILESNQDSDEDFNLNLVFKGQKVQNICKIKERREVLEGLLYILNNYNKASNNI